MSHVKRIDIQNLYVLDNMHFNKSSDDELKEIKKHTSKIKTFVINQYKYGRGCSCIELFFMKKRIERLNTMLERYNICVGVSLSERRKC